MAEQKHNPTELGTALTPCALIVIGNEVLSGKTRDANTAYLGTALLSVGHRLREVRIVADDAGDITRAVHALRAQYAYVFTSGGIGPTHDDITTETIAALFNQRLVLHETVWANLIAKNADAPAAHLAARKKMAYLPERCELIQTTKSAAPGFRIENVCVMAGVPAIFRAMVDAVCANTLTAKPAMISLAMHVWCGESAIAKTFEDLQHTYDGVLELGSYPKTADQAPAPFANQATRYGLTYYTDLWFSGVDSTALHRAFAAMQAHLTTAQIAFDAFDTTNTPDATHRDMG